MIRPTLVAATLALAAGLGALAVLVTLVYSTDLATGWGDSAMLLIGLPVLAFTATLWRAGRARNVPLPALALAGACGLVVLYHLGGIILIGIACTVAPSGGC